MSTRKLLWACRRLLAAGAVVGFLVGCPLLLHRLGSPMPSRWPAWSRVLTDVRIGYVPSSAVDKVAIGAGWALWAFLGYEVLAETWSRLRHHVGRRASALGPLHPLVSKLVAALLLSAPVMARSWPAGALTLPVAVQPIPGSVVQPGAMSVVSAGGGPSDEGPSGPVGAAPPGDLPTYLVQPRDTLWGIAQRLLGDPLRWSDIAALNEDRLEGTSPFGDPHWIQPGWVLLLPADAKAPAPTEPPTVPVAVTPGLAVSASPAPRPQGQGPRAAPPAPSDHSDRSATRRKAIVHPSRLPVAPIGYGLLAAGVIGMLDRMRRAQQRRRPRGLHIRLPDGELSGVERDLRAVADAPLGSSVDLAARLLASLVADAGSAPPPVIAVRCRPQAIEFVLDGGSDVIAGSPPAPFRATDAGSWALDRQWLTGLSPERRQLLSSLEAPLPGLVTLGVDAVDTVLVDVERMGSLSVIGGEATVVLQGMVVELATLPWAEGAEVVVVGHPGELRALDRVRRAPSIAGLLVEMRRRASLQEAAAREVEAPGTIEARWRWGGDSWDPVVVVCLPAAAEAEPEAAIRLAGLAGRGDRGVAVVVGAPLPTRWSAVAGEGTVRLTGPLDVAAIRADKDGGPLALQTARPSLLDDVDALLDVAGAPAVEPPKALRPTPTGDEAPSDADGPRPEVEIRILGPVEVIGAARTFSRAWSLELVVYLAVHTGGASTDQWATALWPDRIMAPASLHSTASAARRALGVSSSGADHLPRAHGRLSLGPSVTSDWAVVQSLATSEDPECWAEALRLVRGRPFETLRASDWAVLEGTVAAMESVIVDLASRLAQWCLEHRDPSGAEWAARRGLRVSPYDERLYRYLLRAADLSGNLAGVENVMQELVRLVADDVEPYDAVHRETWDLYRSLSRHGRLGAGSDRPDQAPSSLARAR